MSFLTQLSQIIKDRFENRSDQSYTSQLFESGVDRICRKVGEESAEVIIAAKNNDLNEIKNESADLLFHLLVLLQHHELSIDDIISTLEERHRP